MHSLVELVELVEGEGVTLWEGGGGMLSHECEDRGASHFITVSQHKDKKKAEKMAYSGCGAGGGGR
jgi:hypothetical protein